MTSTSGAANTSRYQFTGRENDASTGLYYYRARYYNPVTGRFISEDPIGLVGGVNLYRYAAGNPLNLTDPYGLCSNWPPLPDWVKNHPYIAFGGATIVAGVTVACFATGVCEIGAAAAGAAEGAAELTEAGPTLFRAVETAELADIEATGSYNVPEGIGNGKYFYSTQEQAVNFANMNPENSYVLTSAQFPESIVSQSWSGTIAGEGQAYFISGESFPYGPVTVWGPVP